MRSKRFIVREYQKSKFESGDQNNGKEELFTRCILNRPYLMENRIHKKNRRLQSLLHSKILAKFIENR